MPIDNHVVIHLNRAWPRRASVCQMDTEDSPLAFDAARPDYPPKLVPFLDHPIYQRLDEPQRQDILTWAWMGYNERTITAEDCVVNPALQEVAAGLQAPEHWPFHEAIRQTLVDEHFHTLMHLRAMERTRHRRGLTPRLLLPRSITFRRLTSLRASLPFEWQRKIANLAFATVAEISVNAYLDILAEDETVQPSHRAVAQRHNRDEYAHSKVLSEIAKVLYAGFEAPQQTFFVEILPQALQAFVAQDFSMWEAILTQLEVPQAARILADTRSQPGTGVLLRDYSGLHRLAGEAGFLDRLDFDFQDTVAPASQAQPLP